ncbi:c-type cytochrome [Zavarzinella formosa]|uniref:c-type cytochrome n=1 Tax=Zavarzinella formosa TaxID=360055 RepID=UPI0002EE9F75|nr:cytochrome c [Zavarzinella formosa]
MLSRLSAISLSLITPVAALLVVGCIKPSPDPIRQTPVEANFPVRSDWMVLSAPKGTPTGWYLPGQPPLSFLDQPLDSLQGDAALLIPEVKSSAILTTKVFKHLETDPRPLIQTGLDNLFGTPAEPHVGMGEAAIADRLKRMKETIDKTKDADEKASLKEDLKVIEGWQKASAGIEKAVTDLWLEPEMLKKGGDLFRNYCQQCHGATGDGNGPGGKFLIPLPRDYRSGIFKFITAEPNDAGTKPRRSDLARTIRNGLDGSAMPSFAGLRPNQIEELVSYVMFLSIRGESEFQLMKTAADKRKADDYAPAESEKMLFSSLDNILKIWARSNEQPLDMQPDPYATPAQRLEAAARGHRIFLDATQGGCTACHLNYGRNALYQFDAWGGMTRPRNLLQGTYRVSKDPQDLYARLYCGIPGVGMPSHKHLKPTEAEKEAGQSRLWDLVHFIRAAGDAAKRRELREKMGVNLGD